MIVEQEQDLDHGILAYRSGGEKVSTDVDEIKVACRGLRRPR